LYAAAAGVDDADAGDGSAEENPATFDPEGAPIVSGCAAPVEVEELVVAGAVDGGSATSPALVSLVSDAVVSDVSAAVVSDVSAAAAPSGSAMTGSGASAKAKRDAKRWDETTITGGAPRMRQVQGSLQPPSA